jgi:hypothetical protein
MQPRTSPILLSLLALAPTSLSAQTWTTGAPLSEARTQLTATSAGGKALFGGGGLPVFVPGSGWTLDYSDVVDVYDPALGPPSDPAAWSVEHLSQARGFLTSTSVGGLALFAGGSHQSWSQVVSERVDIYDVENDLWSIALLSQNRTEIAATSVGGYALFAGGNPNRLGDPGPASDRVDIYDSSTGIWSQTSLSAARMSLVATTVGPYALFAGGTVYTYGDPSDVVDVYDSRIGPPTDPNAWSVTTLSLSRQPAAATSAGGKAFIAGGIAGAPNYPHVTTIDVYDSCVGPPTDPNAWTVEHLSEPRYRMTATSEGDRALFAGGWHIENGNRIYLDVVDVFDTKTETWSYEALSLARETYGTTVAEYALFAGGDTAVQDHATVDARAATGHWYVEATAAVPGQGTQSEPFPTIQAAIDAAQPGDTVHIAPGTYSLTLVDKDISLVGDCGRDSTVLNGLMLVASGLQVNITGVRFEGSGVRSQWTNGFDIRIADSAFVGCTGQPRGGAISLDSGSLTVLRTDFVDNSIHPLWDAGDDIWVGGGAVSYPIVLRDCRFRRTWTPSSNNSAIDGWYDVRIEGCLFEGVRKPVGHEFPVTYKVATILNSTFVDCGPSTEVHTQARNSIFWNYTLNSLPVQGSFDLQYCIAGSSLFPFAPVSGTGNLNLDPQLDLAGRFLSPLPGSPAIDAGSNAEVPAGMMTDLRGRPRFRDDERTPDTGIGPAPVVDIGAFEYQPRQRTVSGPPRPAGGLQVH